MNCPNEPKLPARTPLYDDGPLAGGGGVAVAAVVEAGVAEAVASNCDVMSIICCWSCASRC